MNSRAKGKNAEREYGELLTAEGWIVEYVKGSFKWNTNVDFFGCFDIIAFHTQLRKWLLVQVKCNTAHGAIKRCREWGEWNKPPYTVVRVAVRKDYKPFEERWVVKTLYES